MCTVLVFFFLLHSLFIQSKKRLGGSIKNHHYIVLPHAHSFHYSPLSKRPAWPAGAPITFQQFWSLTHDKKRTISPARCITKYTFKPFMIVHFLRVWWSGTHYVYFRIHHKRRQYGSKKLEYLVFSFKALKTVQKASLKIVISSLKGIVSRDFEGLQMILMDRIGVPDVPLEVYSFLNFHLHIAF